MGRSAQLLMLLALPPMILAVVTPSLAETGAPQARLACVPPPADLVSWWPGNGNPNDIAGQNNGEWVGTARYAPGVVGKGFRMKRGSFVLVPDSPTLDLTGGITVEGWINYASKKKLQGIIAKRVYFSKTNYALNVGSKRFGVNLYYREDGVFQELHGPRSPDAFHHLAGTYLQVYPGRIDMALYVDGAVIASGIFYGNLENTVNDVPVTIGATLPDSSEHFDGVIDEMSLYNRALSSEEIQAIYAAGSAGKCKV